MASARPCMGIESSHTGKERNQPKKAKLFSFRHLQILQQHQVDRWRLAQNRVNVTLVRVSFVLFFSSTIHSTK